jgi:hypothetical protein
MTDATATTYDLFALYGKPVLFSDVRIDPNTLPAGLHAYELRHSDDDISQPVSLENHVAVNFFGTIISSSPIELTQTRHSYANYDEKDYQPVGADSFTLDDFGSLSLNQYINRQYELTPQPENEIRVLVVEPRKKPYETVVPNTLEAHQKLVGGYIETVYPFDENVALVCNEEGKLEGLPLNRRIGHDIISGTFFLCGSDDRNGSFASLTQEQVKKYINRFSSIELYVEMKQIPQPKPKHKADFAR